MSGILGKERDALDETARGNNMSYSPSSGDSDELNGEGNKKSDQAESSNNAPDRGHRRNISWGLNEVVHLGMPPPVARQRSDTSTMSPTLKSSVAKPESNDSLPTEPLQIPRRYMPTRSTKQAIFELPGNLGIVNPMETEAETYLIQAIERAAAEAEEAQPLILSDIPDEALPQTLREDHEFTASPAIPGNASIGSISIPSFRRPPPAQRSISSPHRTQPPFRHRRKPTLDEQLFGLTHAIQAIHVESNAPYELEIPVPTSNQRLRANTVESAGGTVQEEEASVPNALYDTLPNSLYDTLPNSSYDTFTRNANILYKQRHDDMGVSKQASIRRRRTASNANEEEMHHNDQISEEGGADVATDEEQGIDTPPKDTSEDGGKNVDGSKVQGGFRPANRRSTVISRARALMFDEWGITSEMKTFFRPKRNKIQVFFQVVILSITIPCLASSAILFYFVDNPPTGILRNYGEPIEGKLLNTDGDEVDPNATSASYFILFVGVRQIVTLTMALATQLILIDFLAIDRGYLFRFGSRLPLFIMQARGWPFVLFFWSLFDWALLAGARPFFCHWLYFQKLISLFNNSNPDGNLISSSWNHRILILATGISFAVAIKRFWTAVFLGKQTYERYSDKLAKSLKKMLLISQVAALSRKIVSNQGRATLHTKEEVISNILTNDKIGGLMDNTDDDASEVDSGPADESMGLTVGASEGAKGVPVIDADDKNPLTGNLTSAQRNRIVRLLGAWEEPTEHRTSTEMISIASLMHFRRAMASLRTELPFSASFGAAGTREDCISSSQEVFRRLMTLSDYDHALNFEVLALLGANLDGSLDQEKLVELIKMFRPDRDGSLSMLHFVRSIDKVYKEIRMLRASVNNSSKVDGQLEAIFNFAFYIVVAVCVLYAFGLDPLALFISISGLTVGFAFMIGTASSKYFEGILFILVRRPYSIGDCIHVSDPNQETSPTGSGFWMVEDITLFSTSVRFFFTNERASLSNGSLANSRIINSSKSYNAGVFHYLKFPINVSYEKVKIFHEALEVFVRNRPREWIGLSSFRATKVSANMGYIEYIVCIDHRESWAYWTQVRNSESDLMGFGVELAKKLDIVYQQPTLPIDLNFKPNQIESLRHAFSPPANESSDGPLMPALPEAPPRSSQIESEDIQILAAQFPPRAPRKMTS